MNMQKKTIIITLFIASMFAGICGCGNQEKTSAQSEAAAAEAVSNTKSEEQSLQSSSEGNNYSKTSDADKETASKSLPTVKDSVSSEYTKEANNTDEISVDNKNTESELLSSENKSSLPEFGINELSYRDVLRVGDTFIARINEKGEIMTAGNGSNGFSPKTDGWGPVKRVFPLNDGLAAVDISGALHASLFYPEDAELNESAEIIDLVEAGACLIGLTVNGEVAVIYDPYNDSPEIMSQIPDDSFKTISGSGNLSSQYLCYLTASGKTGMVYHSDDEKTAAGYEKMSQEISSWEDIADISASSDHVLGLKSDGTVVAASIDKDDSDCSVGDWKNIVMIAAGSGHSLGLDSDGNVLACGANGWNQIDVSSWKNIVYVTAGGWNTAAVDKNGNYYFCGKIDIDESNIFGEMNTPEPTPNPAETVPFTNEYGTPTTLCAHPGCSDYIASSGDTNCCEKHSNRCLDCNKYIDEDAMYCMDCIEKALNEVKSNNSEYVSIDSSDDDFWIGVSAAQELVEDELKSPSSAKFPWSGDEYSVSRSGNDWIISGYVDADNSFGASIRTYWFVSCTIKAEGSGYKITNGSVVWK